MAGLANRSNDGALAGAPYPTEELQVFALARRRVYGRGVWLEPPQRGAGELVKLMSSYCILQVEDDPNDVFFMERAFKAAGITHPLRVVRDGQAAIDYLSGAGEFSDRAQWPLPCLILLDLKLPLRDGFEVLAWIRQQPQLQLIPVIVLTSSAREADVDQACLLGANSFLVKPSDLKERAELARALNEYWLRHNRMPSICAHGARQPTLAS